MRRDFNICTVRYVQEMVPYALGVGKLEARSQILSHSSYSNSIVSIRSIIITFVKMKVSPSLIATWVVLSSSSGWVSVKNDEVEVTVVAVLCVAAFLL